MKKCSCYSEKPYRDCCQHFHEGDFPKTALELMRSRFCAYALHLTDYIMQTTYPEKREPESVWRNNLKNFSEKTDFKNLEILDVIEGKKESFVTFTAHMMQNSNDVTFTEKSRFLKEDGRWYYVDGVVKWGKVKLEDFF